jgi:hypothetical protein
VQVGQQWGSVGAERDWVPGSNHAKTYGKAPYEGETFPITLILGQVEQISLSYHADFQDILTCAPGIIFGKVILRNAPQK